MLSCKRCMHGCQLGIETYEGGITSPMCDLVLGVIGWIKNVDFEIVSMAFGLE